jgi:hypothetical protein
MRFLRWVYLCWLKVVEETDGGSLEGVVGLPLQEVRDVIVTDDPG